jgi:hypothetical protein
MSRILGLACALWLLIGYSPASRGQTDSSGSYEGGPYDYGTDVYHDAPSGAFGLDYVQVVPSGRLMMDRFGMVYQAPIVGNQPASASERVNVNANVRATARSRSARARVRRAPALAPMSYQLPTGSLHWPAGEGVLLYAPALRYQSYGGGAARSPYGSINYGSMYMGWPLSY